MVVLYRDKHGRFISKQSAKRRKPENVLSELRKTVTSKSLRIVRGYHPKLRAPVKKKKITFPPSIRPKAKVPVKIPSRPIQEIPEFEEEETEIYPGEDDDIEDWEALSSEGTDRWQSFMKGLDHLDEIEDYPEEEWYEEA